jgi:hypothetical protein
MKILGRKEIESLIEKKCDRCISIYMPVHRLGDQQDNIRYKNLLGKAEKLLTEKGLRSVRAAQLLAPEYDLLSDLEFWKNPGADGLAVFCSDDIRQRYLLPRSFEESVTVGKRFRVKPLIPLVAEDGRFFVLALSRGNVRLFQAGRFGISEIGLPEGAPASMQEALKYDDPQRQLQYHTGTAGTGGARRQAMFHGHGVGIDEERENTLRFFQQLEKHLHPVFYGEKIPVVVAGVESLPPVYRDIDSSGMVVPESLDSNPDALDIEDLHRRSWDIVAPLFAEGEKKAREKFEELHGTGRAVTDLTAVVAAAVDGRIETLFTLEDEELWGVYDPEKNMVIPTAPDFPGAVDLLDFAAAMTLVNSGRVYVQRPGEMPVEADIAAILRYV